MEELDALHPTPPLNLDHPSKLYFSVKYNLDGWSRVKRGVGWRASHLSSYFFLYGVPYRILSSLRGRSRGRKEGTRLCFLGNSTYICICCTICAPPCLLKTAIFNDWLITLSILHCSTKAICSSYLLLFKKIFYVTKISCRNKNIQSKIFILHESSKTIV